MFKLTGYKRYFLRELLPRAILIGVCTFFLLPYTPGLAFHGGSGASVVVALFFTAYFWLWGSKIMAARPLRKFIVSIDSDFWTGVFYVATLFLIPLPAVILPVLVAPQIFVCTAWYGLLIWIVGLNICCAVTHDYGPS
jgi:multisubunit Na+/H+ antiporter MnhB subunit